MISILEESGLELGEFGLGHAPERTMTGTAIRDITGEYPKIIGADDENTLKVLDVVYSIINDKGTIKMENIISAESVKVFEGVYRDVNIALANELAKYCEEKGINALDVFEAANSQPYCDIHEPGAGVAGHCIPVYPWFVINQTKKRNNELLRTAREINDSMPYHMIDLTIKGLNEVERSVKNSNILILGLTFRGGVKEFMKTPAEPIIKELKELGANVFAYDPICEPEDAERYGAEWKEGYEDVDAIMIITDHEQFKELDFEKIGGEVRNKVLIDGRNVVKPEEMKKLGFEYKRVGL
ncbi:MAG: nucleotide sugar dehydrogenase [Thermoplasmata archaeon]